MQLKGKHCVITGASSGIGLAVTKKLLSEGASVVAAALDMNSAAPELQHPNLVRYTCDLSDPESVDQLFVFAAEHLGTIDLFFANAGYAYHERIANADWEHAAHIFRTNVLSPVYALEKMKMLHQNQPFLFLITASAMSFLALPGYSLYASTKASLHRFAESYRFELSPGQRLCLVYPIATKTRFFQQAHSSYVPWPAQDTDKVADCILKGIRRNRSAIYPSRLFMLTMGLLTLFPFLKHRYLASEWKKAQL